MILCLSPPLEHSQRAAGIIIIQDNKIRLEKYAMGYNASGRWTSFSVAKSFTSTLAGARSQPHCFRTTVQCGAVAPSARGVSGD